MAIQTANSAGSTIILATDPDADRLALAEKDAVTGKWKVFNGNEAGTLLSWWAFKNYKDSHPDFDGERESDYVHADWTFNETGVMDQSCRSYLQQAQCVQSLP